MHKPKNSPDADNKVSGNTREGGSFAEQLSPENEPGISTGSDLHSTRNKFIGIFSGSENQTRKRFASRVARQLKKNNSTG